MTLCSLREVLDHARAGGYGVGAFTVTDIEQVEAVLDAAAATSSPVIVQTIAGASAFASDELYWDLLLRTVDHYPQIPIMVHLDHGPDAETCKRAIDAGFSSVMIDGSLDPVTHKPTSFEANVAVTREVVAYARERGVSVEAELGTIGGSKDGATHAEIVLADPEEARRFVEETDVDALAVAIGTSHGAYKFTSPPDGTVLRMDLIETIASLIPDTHLVMHGSSSLRASSRSTREWTPTWPTPPPCAWRSRPIRSPLTRRRRRVRDVPRCRRSSRSAWRCSARPDARPTTWAPPCGSRRRSAGADASRRRGRRTSGGGGVAVGGGG